MQLYFIRHGQSQNNAIWDENAYDATRVSDPTLTSKGIQQAELLAEFLAQGNPSGQSGWMDPQNRAGFGLTHVYCSLMERAIQTGTIISDRLGIPLIAHKDMHEVGGIYLDRLVDDQPMVTIEHGHTPAYLQEHYPRLKLATPIKENGWWLGGREQRPRRISRARRVIEFLKQQHGNTQDRVAVITHGAFFSYIFRVLFNLDVDYPGDRGLPYFIVHNNCGLTRMELDASNVTLYYLNRTDFLPDDLIT